MFLNSGRVCIQLECSMGGDKTTLYVLWVSRSVTPSPFLENLCSCVIKQLPISKLPLASLLRYDLCTAIHLEMSFICLWMRTVIQMKGRAPGLTLGKGLKVTEKYQKRSVNQKWICSQGTQRWPVWSSQIARFGVGYRVSWHRKNSTSFYNLIAKPLIQELSENMRVNFLITHLLFPCRLFQYLFLWGR